MASWWERHGVPRLIKCACSQGQIMKARSKVVPHAAGDVLELGCGGGINMEFYDSARVTSFTGLDPSPELLVMSRAAAQAHGIDADIQGGVGEAMPFGDARFDTVVTTFTLCSVAEQSAVPPGFSTRRISFSTALCSATEHSVKVVTTVSKRALSNGIASPTPPWISASMPCACAAARLIARSSGEGSSPVKLVTRARS